MTRVHFWNGNKTAVRQKYELSVLSLALEASADTSAASQITEDQTDYPNALDEGAIFTRNIDVCVTVAGNPKFKQGEFIPVYYPLMQGLLGHRLLIVREADANDFANIRQTEELKQRVAGIPATWADAPLFRDNGFAVSEKGTLDDLFNRLKAGECDYVALGVNEIHAIYEGYGKPLGGLILETRLRLYYPFALVFYVNPHKRALAQQLKLGLEQLVLSGRMQQLFSAETRAILQTARLNLRTEISLFNPALPAPLTTAMASCKDALLAWD